MSTVIVRAAIRLVMPLLFLLSIYLLLVGHNAPGGGFAGGLTAAGALTLYGLANGGRALRRFLRVDPQMVAGAGLLICLLSGLSAFVAGLPFLTGLWIKLRFSPDLEVSLGTPLLFDLGVFLTVLGATVGMILLLLGDE